MRFTLLFLVIFISGCFDDPVKKYLDQKYPPVSVEEQQNQAITVLANSISNMEYPAISVGVSIEAIEEVIASEIQDDPSVVSFKLASQEQMITAKVELKKKFTQADWKDNEEINNILGSKEVIFEGIVNIGLTITTQNIPTADTRTLVLKALPHIHSVDVEKVQSDAIGVEIIADALFFLLNRYVDNINGEISRLPLLQTEIPTEAIDAENPSRMMRSKDDAQISYSINLTSQPVVSPFSLGELAVLIDKSHVRAIASFIPLTRDEQQEKHTIPIDFDSAKQAFQQIHLDSFGENLLTERSWVVISKNMVSFTLSNVISQTQACFDINASLPTDDIPSARIPGPDWEGISCDSERDCRQNRSCDYDRPHDTRDCSACLLRAPRVCLPDTPFGRGSCSGGQCVQRGNDPVCEAAKAAQNLAYNTEHEARVAACRGEKEVARMACEAEKAAEKGLCEVGKEAVKRIALAGDVASIGGKIGGSTDANICLQNMAVAQDLSNLQMVMKIGGNVELEGHLQLTPLNLGHTICVAPTKAPLDFDIRIPSKSQSIVASINLEQRDGDYGFAFRTEEITFPVNLSPSPTEWILKNIDMTIKCPITNIAKPLIVTATPFIPELRGITKYTQDATDNFVKLELPKQKINDIELLYGMRDNDKAIVLSAN